MFATDWSIYLPTCLTYPQEVGTPAGVPGPRLARMVRLHRFPTKSSRFTVPEPALAASGGASSSKEKEIDMEKQVEQLTEEQVKGQSDIGQRSVRYRSEVSWK